MGRYNIGDRIKSDSLNYTELEYLELQGGAYFNTGVYLSKDMDIEFEFMPTINAFSGVFGGARTDNNPGAGYFFASNPSNTFVDFFGADFNYGRWLIARSGSSDFVVQLNKKYKLTIINKVGSLTEDGVTVDTHTYSANGISPNVDPLYINAINKAGTIEGFNSNGCWRFYHFSATGVADIVPVKRSDNVLGLYNKTTGNFIPKIGNGKLVAGPETSTIIPGMSEDIGVVIGFQKRNLLPNEYTELQYITASGGQYITTGLSGEIRWVGAGQGTSDADGSKCILGAYNGSANVYIASRFGSNTGAAYKRWTIDGGSSTSISGLDYAEYDITFIDDSFTGTINDKSVSKTGYHDFTTWWIGTCFGSGSAQYPFVGNIYRQKAYQNNSLAGDFVPAMRNSDSVVGMYDLVSNTFYTNEGSGSFTAGPLVNLPNTYQELEYIESTGTQVIDTGFVYSNNTRVIWDVQLTATLPISVSNNFGVGFVNTNYERLGFAYGASNQKIAFFKATSSGDTILRTTVDVDNNRHVLEINSPINKAHVDGDEYTFDPAVGDINNDHNLTLPLLAWLGNTGYREYFTGRLYSVKIYDNGIIVRDLVPAMRKSDRVVGMYDLVTKTFLTNSGTGSFIAGPLQTSNDNNYAVVCLNAKYRTSTNMTIMSIVGENASVDNDTRLIISGLLTYSAQGNEGYIGTSWLEKERLEESATVGTQKVLEYMNTDSTYYSPAANNARSKSFIIDGVMYYGQIPNMSEVIQMLYMRSKIESTDPTRSLYPSLNLTGKRIVSFTQYGWDPAQNWACYSVSDAMGTLIHWYKSQTTYNSSMPMDYFLAPVIEIPND